MPDGGGAGEGASAGTREAHTLAAARLGTHIHRLAFSALAAHWAGGRKKAPVRPLAHSISRSLGDEEPVAAAPRDA